MKDICFFLLLKLNLYAKLHCCFNLNADQTSLVEAIQHSESLPVFGKGQKLLCLGLFWQPAAHCCHALFEIEKKSKFTWALVMLQREEENKSTETAVCK